MVFQEEAVLVKAQKLTCLSQCPKHHKIKGCVCNNAHNNRPSPSSDACEPASLSTLQKSLERCGKTLHHAWDIVSCEVYVCGAWAQTAVQWLAWLSRKQQSGKMEKQILWQSLDLSKDFEFENTKSHCTHGSAFITNL